MTTRKQVFRFSVHRKRQSAAMEQLAHYGEAITHGAAVAAVVRSVLGRGECREHFVVLYADVLLHIIGFEVVAVGTETEVPAEPRLVFRGAILAGVHAVFVAHNHPSGRAQPSDADDMLTRRLVDAGKILGIGLLDHIVVTEDSHYSYAANGRLLG